MKANLLLAPLAALLLASSAASQTVLSLETTWASGNGQNGNMFDVMARETIRVTGFDVHYDSGTVNLEIYSTLGGYQGKENTPGAWTLEAAVQITGQGDVSSGGQETPVPLMLDIEIQAGQTMGFYITNMGGGEPNANYTNGTGTTRYENNEITITEGLGNQYPFSSTYSPRIWNGRIYYTAGGLDGIPDQLSLASGGAQVLTLAPGAQYATNQYLIAGSFSGTAPGFPLGGFTIQLNIDPYLFFTVNNLNSQILNGNFGVLNSLGQGTAVFSLPPGSDPALAGVTINHVGLVLDLASGLTILEVTEPAPLLLLP
jgi:hypothetical protein